MFLNCLSNLLFKKGVVRTRILYIEDSKKPRGVEIKAIMGLPEFEQLVGSLENLCVFACKTITEPASVIKTGARHSWAKYILFPVKLRRKFETTDFDFENLTCGTVEYKDKLYVVYGMKRKVLAVPSDERKER